MKRLPSFIAVVLFLSIAVAIPSSGCSKKSSAECKTCKAYSVDGIVGEEEVCSEAEEQDFRSEFAGKEISCQ